MLFQIVSKYSLSKSCFEYKFLSHGNVWQLEFWVYIIVWKLVFWLVVLKNVAIYIDSEAFLQILGSSALRGLWPVDPSSRQARIKWGAVGLVKSWKRFENNMKKLSWMSGVVWWMSVWWMSYNQERRRLHNFTRHRMIGRLLDTPCKWHRGIEQPFESFEALLSILFFMEHLEC